MHSALARQLPGYSASGRGSAQPQSHPLPFGARERHIVRPFSASSRHNCRTVQQHSRCSRSRRPSSARVCAEYVSQEERELQKDYGALSERLEVILLSSGIAQGFAVYVSLQLTPALLMRHA